jgi:hypothetical protein
VIVTPVIVDERGDVLFFESVERAEGKLEAIDVRNEEYVAYDSEGRLLKLAIERSETSTFFGLGTNVLDYVVVEGAEDRPNHAPQLPAVLVRFSGGLIFNLPSCLLSHYRTWSEEAWNVRGSPSRLLSFRRIDLAHVNRNRKVSRNLWLLTPETSSARLSSLPGP